MFMCIDRHISLFVYRDWVIPTFETAKLLSETFLIDGIGYTLWTFLYNS